MEEVCYFCGKEALAECDECGEFYCEDCKANYNQFTQIDWNCCKKCEEDIRNEGE